MNYLIIFTVYALIIIAKIIVNIKNDKDWSEGVFKNNIKEQYPEDEDPLLEAYISLGALMIRKDRSSYREKLSYLNSYFSKNFPKTHYNFGRSFTESLKNPVHPRAITLWLRRKLPKREQRIQIMYFLAGLSNVDGSINHQEIKLLKEMNLLLGLSSRDFESIIGMYTQRNQRKNNSNPIKETLSKTKIAAKILGVSENSSESELKKAYRRLVKLHHPDRFSKASEEQQEIAEQRFIEVQKAYEILKKRISS